MLQSASSSGINFAKNAKALNFTSKRSLAMTFRKEIDLLSYSLSLSFFGRIMNFKGCASDAPCIWLTIYILNLRTLFFWANIFLWKNYLYFELCLFNFGLRVKRFFIGTWRCWTNLDFYQAGEVVMANGRLQQGVISTKWSRCCHWHLLFTIHLTVLSSRKTIYHSCSHFWGELKKRNKKWPVLAPLQRLSTT